MPQVAEFLRGIDDPGQIADTAGYSPDLTFEQKIEVLETIDVEARLELVLALGEGHAGRPGAEGQDPHRRQRGHGEAPARVPAARADERDPQGARRGRRGRRRRGVPHEDRRGGHARRRSGAGRARAGPPGALQRAVARVRLDPHLPRLDDRRAVVGPHRGQPRDRRGARRARRRPRGLAGREGPHPGVPGRAEAACRARTGRGDRARLRRDPHPGGASRRRQDLAGRVGRARPRPQLRSCLARRHPRRGRDPRSPAHVRGRAARAASSVR